MTKSEKNGYMEPKEDHREDTVPRRGEAVDAVLPNGVLPNRGSTVAASGRQSTVAKVSHTLSIALAERLEEFAFFQRVSESAVIEHSLTAFFAQSNDDAKLGDELRSGGAGRRRKR